PDEHTAPGLDIDGIGPLAGTIDAPRTYPYRLGRWESILRTVRADDAGIRWNPRIAEENIQRTRYNRGGTSGGGDDPQGNRPAPRCGIHHRPRIAPVRCRRRGSVAEIPLI